MRLFRLLLVATLWVVALGFTAAPAHAAGIISVSPPTWEKRDPDRLINKFNRKDCLDGAEATFSVSLRGAPVNALFQVWSGTGCDQYANRSSTAVSRTCTLVTGDLAVQDQRVTINLRDMLATFGATVNNSETECDASTTAGLQTRSLYFVVSDPSSNMTVATGTNTTWAFTYDVKAPAPPTEVSAESGDGSLITTFKAPSGETNLLRYKFYCSLIGDAPVTTGGTAGAGGTAGTGGTDASANGGTGATAGTDTGGTGATAGTDTGGTEATAGTDTGGTGATAGTDTGGAGTSGTAGTSQTAGTAGTTSAAEVDPECQSSILVPGQPVPLGAEGLIDCGEIEASGAKGDETDRVLTNDIKYVVAIATEDNVNNIGVLSKLACNVPKDTTGFIEAYGEAGGEAGGGFCTFAPAQHGAWATLVAFLIGASALVRRRK